MPWRKIRPADIQRGVCIRMTDMKDTPYNGATIMGIEDESIACRTVHLARPMAYAHEHFDSTHGGPLSAENFSISWERMCQEDSDIEVYQTERGTLTRMTT